MFTQQGMCTPGYVDILVDTTWLRNVPHTCVDAKTDVRAAGLYESGTRVRWFEDGHRALGHQNVTLEGTLFAYMHIWGPNLDQFETRYWIRLDNPASIRETVLLNGEFETP
jgi:hypothetical protein